MNEYAAFSSHYCTQNRILFFVAVKKGQHPQELIAHRCIETLAETFIIDSAAGMSVCGDADVSLRKLAKQAMAAADMHWIRGWRSFQLFLPEEEENNHRFFERNRKEYTGISSIYYIEELMQCLRQIHAHINKARFIRKDAIRHQFTDFAFCVNDKLAKAGLEHLSFEQEEMQQEAESYAVFFQVYEDKIGRIEEYIRAEGSKQEIIQIKEYIASHLEYKILLQDIADEVHLTRTYISSLFKKETGMNINDYITKEKLLYAKNLLLEGESISSTVEKTGIQSESYFSRLFRKEYHMTPSAFVKEHRK